MVEHSVWSIPPGKAKPVCWATFELSRWQWAMKLARYLQDKGHTDVEVCLDTGESEADDES